MWKSWGSGRAVEKAAVRPSDLPAELKPVGGFLGSFFNIGGIVHEPFAGAWQRNVSEASDRSILAFSAVYACIAIISGDLAKLPLRIMRKLPGGGYAEAVNHPMTAVLYAPNHYQTRVDFVQQFVVSLLMNGNTYVWIERDARGVPAALYVLNPQTVRPLIAETGDVFYLVTRDRLAGMGATPSAVTIPASEIIHHRLATLDHPLVGVTPIYAAASSAMVGARAMMNSARFFANQSRPSGIITSPGTVSKETAIELKEQWEANYGPRGQGRTAVLGEGMKWEPMTMTAVDAQLIEQLRYSVEDVARVFRVPPFLLGELSKVTYRNSEQLNRMYYSGCLQYHMEAIETRLDMAFKLASDVEIEFDLDPLLRTEMDVRFEAYQKAIQSGFKTINEIRAKEGDAPIDGGNEPLIQVQYTPLSQLGKTPPAPPPPAAPAAPAAEEPVPPTAEEDSFNALARALELRFGAEVSDAAA